jgi:hypothetical protein
MKNVNIPLESALHADRLKMSQSQISEVCGWGVAIAVTVKGALWMRSMKNCKKSHNYFKK